MNTRLFDYFDRIYVVYLPERTDRIKHMKHQLTRLGLLTKAIWFPGCKYTDKGGFPGAGVRGCVMSQYTILNQAAKDGVEKLLILQDDCQFSNRMVRQEQAIVDELANSYWDFAYLGHGAKIEDSKTFFVKVDAQKQIMLTHFCAYHGRAIPRLIKLMENSFNRLPGDAEGGPMYFDGYMNFFKSRNPDLVTLVAAPSLGWQYSNASNLNPSPLDQNKLLFPMVQLARTVKNSVQSLGYTMTT